MTGCAGLPRSMWAAAVPANYDRSLGALVEDIYGDHQLMVRLPHMLKGPADPIRDISLAISHCSFPI